MGQVWLAADGDAPTVAALLVEFRDWLGLDWPSADSYRRSVERLLRDPCTEFLLGAPAGGEPAGGVCQLRYRHSVWYGAEDCCLEDLYVREGARRAGLGRALAEAALERARRRGCGRVELEVNEANPAAVALYEALGFSAWSEPLGGRSLMMRLRL